jgi:hypothetical protein
MIPQLDRIPESERRHDRGDCRAITTKDQEADMKDYLDMTVREVLDMLKKNNMGQLAFNGPGANGEDREPYCVAFAAGYEDAAELSRKVLGSTKGLPESTSVSAVPGAK